MKFWQIEIHWLLLAILAGTFLAKYVCKEDERIIMNPSKGRL